MFGPAAAGPFQHHDPQSRIQTPFQRLKPICVELLGLVGLGKGAAQTQQVLFCLRRLKTTLKTLLLENGVSTEAGPVSSSSRVVPARIEPILPQSLIEYIFYPISELISLAPAGITSLPDSVEEETLNVIALLCTQWREVWSEKSSLGDIKLWRTWCDLVILASSILGQPSSKREASEATPRASASDEVKLAALRVLDELLAPRFRTQGSSKSAKDTSSADWEWDGASDLPLMDEHDTGANLASISTLKHEQPESETSLQPQIRLAFPTPAHLSYATSDRVAKGAISFVLSSSFTIAESSQDTTKVRESALCAARHALLLWVGGTCPLPSSPNQDRLALQVSQLYYVELPQMASPSTFLKGANAQKQVLLRLRQLLPGITSSLTRLATSRLKPKRGEPKLKPTPGPVAVAAIDFLGDLLRATLSDECLLDAIAHSAPLGGSDDHLQASVKVTDLEEFADRATEDSAFQNDEDPMPSRHADSTPNATAADPEAKEYQWALSTLAQVHLALKTFSPLTQPSLPGTSLPSNVHASVQKAMLHLAAVLINDCMRSFSWLDEQLQAMARLDASKTSASGNSAGGTDNSSINTLLSWIVDLASDSTSEAVAQHGKAAFRALQTRIRGGQALWSLLIQAFGGLPSAIAAENDDVASRLTLRIISILDLLSSPSETVGLIGVAKMTQDMRPGFARLVHPLRIERLEFVEEAADGISPYSTWRLQPYFTGLEASTSKHLSRMFFTFGRSLAIFIVQILKSDRMGDNGKTDASHVFSIITTLIERAAELRSVRLSSVDNADQIDEGKLQRQESLISLVVATEMLRGVSSILDNLQLELQFADMGTGAMQASKRARKVAHKLSKQVFRLVMVMLDGDAEEAVTARSAKPKPEPDARSSRERVEYDKVRDVGLAQDKPPERTLVERLKGISIAPEDIESSTPERHGPALDLGFVRAANLSRTSKGPANQAQTNLALQHRYQQAERSLNFSNALLFNLLSSVSKLLGQSFRSLLLRGSYALVSGMSVSPHTSSELVRQASTSAMRDIAFNTAYADVKNCLLDHADYILGSACQRLISGLDEELRTIAQADSSIDKMDQQSRAVIGSGASDVAAVVQPLVSAQRAPFVLVEMIRVLGSEIVPAVEDAIDEILDALDRFHHHSAICDGLLSVLDSILETMAAEQASNPTDASQSTIQMLLAGTEAEKMTAAEDFAAWLSSRREEQSAFDATDDDGQDSKDSKRDQEDKPNKSQQVASQILSKACAFLTHPSPLLRARILGLLRHGIETLAPQARTAELLPIVNRAWPFVMTRLGPSYSNRTGLGSRQSAPIIDLKPASIGSRGRAQDETVYSRMEANFVEKDPQVWLAAAQFVESVAKHVPDFVGKRVVEEAWPRFEQLLDLMRWKFDPRMHRGHVSIAQSASQEKKVKSDVPKSFLIDTHSASSRSNTQPNIGIEAPFILPSASGIPVQLTLRIAATITTTIRHLNARMPDNVAWAITTHHFLLDLLDLRQPPALMRAAEELFAELVKRNPEATIWAIQAAFPQAAETVLHTKMATPCFMHHMQTNVHAETLHHIVSGFVTF